MSFYSNKSNQKYSRLYSKNKHRKNSYYGQRRSLYQIFDELSSLPRVSNEEMKERKDAASQCLSDESPIYHLAMHEFQKKILSKVQRMSRADELDDGTWIAICFLIVRFLKEFFESIIAIKSNQNIN